MASYRRDLEKVEATAISVHGLALLLVETGEAGMPDYLWRFFLPTLTGNVIGRVALVAVLNYGQGAPELEE